ncbi:response regulator, partial [Lacticaseibacillus rhamnosus]
MRAQTVLAAIDPATKPSDLARPGHIHPLRARPGGVLERTGQTEAAVDLARTGIDGMHAALTGEYDLVILDVMLPGLDGWDVLRALRAAGRTMPVLFLSARDRIEDRVKGLELGADDYLTKPFAFA